MRDKVYRFSFTAGGALIPETTVVAKYQYQCKDWRKTKIDTIEQNLLLKEKKATAVRQYAEIESRLKKLSEKEIDILCTGTPEDEKSMMWLSIIKTYKFIEELFASVILKNFQERKNIISDSDYYQFWESKKSVTEEIATLSDSSVKKIKQVIFKMLFDLGFIDSLKTKTIVRPVLTESTEVQIAREYPALLRFFLYEDYEIKQILSKL